MSHPEKSIKTIPQITQGLFNQTIADFYDYADASDHLQTHHEVIKLILSPNSGIKKEQATYLADMLQLQSHFFIALRERWEAVSKSNNLLNPEL